MGDGLLTDQELDRLQWTTVLYDLHETNPDNGLVRDKTDPAAPSSIAAGYKGFFYHFLDFETGRRC
jgi:hypothetical protein